MRDDKNVLTDDLLGKYVLTKCRRSGDRRMFIQIPGQARILDSDGYRNVFTLSEKPIEAGYHLCKIIAFSKDKSGNPMMIVKSVQYLGIEADLDSSGWDLLKRYDGFAERFRGETAEIKNLDRVLKKLNCKDISDVFRKYLDGMISVEHIGYVLLMPPESYVDCAAYMQIAVGDKEHPLLRDKILNGAFGSCREFSEFVDRKYGEAERLGLSQEGGYIDTAERVLQYRKQQKLAEKAARREKRHAAKQKI